jgi:hypothetical protein
LISRTPLACRQVRRISIPIFFGLLLMVLFTYPETKELLSTKSSRSSKLSVNRLLQSKV